jgi:hypothetical protein
MKIRIQFNTLLFINRDMIKKYKFGQENIAVWRVTIWPVYPIQLTTRLVIYRCKINELNKGKKIDEKFIWILDLKEAHAQRIANLYAARLSRVGLDESEWLRRWAGN